MCFILSSPSGFILSFASSASKKISDSVAETAQTIKKTVEESNIDGIMDKVQHTNHQALFISGGLNVF